MKQLIIQKSSSSNRHFFSKLFLPFFLIWVVIAVPICFLTFKFLTSQIDTQAEVSRNNQEVVLNQIFEQTTRFGDIINPRANLEAIGKEFGLRHLFVCKDGFDISGGLIPIKCPNVKSYQIRVLDQNLDIAYEWAQASSAIHPIVIRSILITCAISAIIFILISLFTYKFLTKKIINLSDQIAQSGNDRISFQSGISELDPIVKSLNFMKDRVEDANEQISNLKASAAKAKLAQQVAHDIRSPLSALKIFAAKFIGEQDSRDLVENAVHRIEGITSDLLRKNEKNSVTAEIDKKFFEDFVALKIVEAPSNTKVTLDTNLDTRISICLSSTTLFRCLSNIVNNSIEASIKKKILEIKISAFYTDGTLSIEISDNGKGIPEHLIAKIGRSNFTFGKKNSASGYGLGIQYVFNKTEEAGGSASISSTEGEGTVFKLGFPANQLIQ